jgi:hypothetical protein
VIGDLGFKLYGNRQINLGVNFTADLTDGLTWRPQNAFPLPPDRVECLPKLPVDAPFRASGDWPNLVRNYKRTPGSVPRLQRRRTIPKSGPPHHGERASSIGWKEVFLNRSGIVARKESRSL